LFDASELEETLTIGIDAFTQAMINPVENAIKLSSVEAGRQIYIGCACSRDTTICIIVKDYGISITTIKCGKYSTYFTVQKANSLAKQRVRGSATHWRTSAWPR